MNKYAVLAVASLAMPAVAAQAAPDVNTNPAAVPSGHYTSVPGHTEVTFGIIHMGMSPFTRQGVSSSSRERTARYVMIWVRGEPLPRGEVAEWSKAAVC